MTTEKAIEYWKARYENTKYFDDVHCDASELREHKEYVEALKETITELEKQVPKKPIAKPYFYGKRYYCSECQHYICADYNTKNPYCSNCGQALNWEENENE